MDRARELVLFQARAPLLALLFGFLSARRAILLVVIAGYVFMPSGSLSYTLPAGFWELLRDKTTATGLAILMGLAWADPQVWRRVRPHPLDLAMAAYACYPLLGLMTGGTAVVDSVADLFVQRTFGWLVPYLAGRLYFTRTEEVRWLAAALVVVTLVHAPYALWEAVMGPSWYLTSWIFDVPARAEARLGAITPQGFMFRRLEFAAWSSLIACLACWLWAGRGWRPRWGPSWAPALLLLIVAVVNRSVYGYITLAAGLVIGVATLALRTRAFLVLLALCPPLYVGLRLAGVLDTPSLTRQIERRIPNYAGTVTIRLAAEQDVWDKLADVGGGRLLGSGSRQWMSPTPVKFPDSFWAQVLWEGGLVGLGLHWLALYGVPVVAALSRPRGRPDRAEIGAPAWGLAYVLLIHMFDGIHNASPSYPIALIGGALVGHRLGRDSASGRSGRRAADEAEGAATASSRAARGPSERGPMPASVPTLAALAALLMACGPIGEALGLPILLLASGLGTGLLFAAAGAIGSWASPRFSTDRLGAFALVFAILGVSFNLIVNPTGRPLAMAGLFQGIALCALVVALGRKWLGDGPWVGPLLAAVALAGHAALLGLSDANAGRLDVGSFLFATGTTPRYPLFPWLALAALGAWSAWEGTWVNLAAAALFGGGAAWMGLNPTHVNAVTAPVVFPMNSTAALLACAVVCLGFVLARGLNTWERSRLVLRGLGGRSLMAIFLVFGLDRLWLQAGASIPAGARTALAVGALALTAALAPALKPLGPWLRSAGPWAALGLIVGLVGASAASLPPAVVIGVGCVVGLVLAAHFGALAACVGAAGSSAPVREPENTLVEDTLPCQLVRLIALLALLGAPELVGLMEARRPAAPAPIEGKGETVDPTPERPAP